MKKNAIKSGKIGPYKWAIYQEEHPESPLNLYEQFGTLISETSDTEFFNDNGKYHRRNMAAAVREARNSRAPVVITANADARGATRIPWWELDENAPPQALYFCTKQEIEKEGWTRGTRGTPAQQAEKYTLAVLREVAAWIDGEVYGYEVTRKGEHVESCWGFYGDIEYVIKEAKEAAEQYNIKHQSGKEFARRFMCC